MSAGLEGAEHAHHKGILCKCQDVSLHKHLLDLVPQNQVLSVDLFHRKTLPSFFMPHQIHGPAGQMGNIAAGCLDNVLRALWDWRHRILILERLSKRCFMILLVTKLVIRDGAPKILHFTIIYSPLKLLQKMFWEMCLTKQFLVPTDLYSIIFFTLWQSMGTNNPLVKHILQNILLCVQQKKNETKQRYGTIWMQVNDDKFHFWVNYPFKWSTFPLWNSSDYH